MTLPPLAAIRAFEAVARHLSFTRAAEELGMTQAAVSYQIRLLEERVGTPLFLRKPRQVELTAAGLRLAPEVAQAFELLRSGFARSRGQVDGMLALSSVPTFASQWLAPNIGLFQLAHPDIAVRVESSGHLVDFAAEEFDAVIRATNHEVEGLVYHRLLDAEFAPMISPKLMEEYQIREPRDLLRVPQITPDDPWFIKWLELSGIEPPKFDDRPFSRLESQYMEAAAVAAGRGFAMMTPAFYPEEMASGRLVQPFETVGWNGHAYYLVYPETRRNQPKIRAFRDWIVDATAPLRQSQRGIAVK
ncbi:LysR substrate-binding domain-containing protein [Devosia aurantiaca]|uniref:LysR family transcriptional regulator n=1 Tax=Devosia aurantiaca TaxID=2714858 RepID=A0A6M1T1A4_9HYPH|nr:LysR substrate-binding domain-containing protein [Devosia aurantiaca]NGP18641.1 LysR family transcriptional regulator [Devosia aurantiaca]